MEHAITDSFLALRHRPFLDLGAAATGGIPVYKVEYDAQDMMNGQRSDFNIQRLMPGSFRKLLVQETRLPRYDVADPLDLPAELATDRWQYLQDQLNAYRRLSPKRQILVAKLLLSLGFQPLVRSLVPQYEPEAIASCREVADLALLRAVAAHIIHADFGTPFDPSEFEIVALNAPAGHFARIGAGLALIVFAAKSMKSVELTGQWSRYVKKAFAGMSSLDTFGRHLISSCVYRATAMYPFLKGDKQAMVEEMDRSEHHARHLFSVADTAKRDLLARENLMTVLESRSKEAMALRDLDLAQARCREVISYDDLDPKHFLELGDILARLGKTEEALKEYSRSALLGPPGTPAAWFMMGQCFELLDQKEAAANSYVQTLQVDPLGYSAAERLHDLAASLGWPELANWARDRAEEALN